MRPQRAPSAYPWRRISSAKPLLSLKHPGHRVLFSFRVLAPASHGDASYQPKENPRETDPPKWIAS